MDYLTIIIITLIVGFGTQAYIKAQYRKYSKVSNELQATGAQMARRMLDDHGLFDVQVARVAGTLTDHYDPKSRVVSLSDGIYNGATVSAIAVACHECGHAVQHATAYGPLKFRTALVPVVNFSSSVWLILLIVGIFLNLLGMVYLAIILYAFAVLFQIVTLPVEFNASHRALDYLKSGIGSVSSTALSFGQSTTDGASKVLTAAALTYVAAALTSILQLLYYLSIFTDN